jgi:hypothetical protein
MDELTVDEQQTLRKAILRMHERGCGVAVGLLAGLGLFVSTNILVMRGGPVVGPHLSLLGVYLPGYSVSLFGSFIGLAYGFVIGYATGLFVAYTYNRLSDRSR